VRWRMMKTTMEMPTRTKMEWKSRFKMYPFMVPLQEPKRFLLLVEISYNNSGIKQSVLYIISDPSAQRETWPPDRGQGPLEERPFGP
jgi:hypothetical protein